MYFKRARRAAANADMRASRAVLREQGRAPVENSQQLKGGGYESHSKCLSGKENALVRTKPLGFTRKGACTLARFFPPPLREEVKIKKSKRGVLLEVLVHTD